MSRSQYIYVVTHPRQSMPLATFTVKHELRKYLRPLLEREPILRHALSLYRFDDGPDGRIAEMDVQAVLEGRTGSNDIETDLTPRTAAK